MNGFVLKNAVTSDEEFARRQRASVERGRGSTKGTRFALEDEGASAEARYFVLRGGGASAEGGIGKQIS